ncbi:hypothetical protein PIROE2DRAFT_5379 [Piromyces sp. E2]|nr:hypothetical protein PIROE2DRAFT_5379 [Piromyces sp. E2]|eukprot:OUM67222.1 hypothetical protein PIROE2DRAFT_5379 [Piromyces sp. E2]
MKFSKNILLLTSMLVANAHFVKRDETNTKMNIFKSIIPNPNDYERIVEDAAKSNRIPMLSAVEVDVVEKDEVDDLINFKNGKYMKSAIEDPFHLNVHCYSSDDCGDYPSRIQEGAFYVAQVFEFYQPVKVNVTIFPFCRFMKEAGCETIMGITYPPTFVPLAENKDSEAFLYPQALVKQLDIDSNIEYSDIDFIIYLNSSYKPTVSQDNRALIAAHEILHGMGFFHQINPISVYINNYQNYFNNDFALPPINCKESDDIVIYDGWTPFSIFDKYIVNTAQPEDYLYKKLEKYRTHNVNFEISTKKPTTKQYNDFMNTFKELESDQEASIGGVEVASLFTTLNAVGFHTKDGKIVELQTFDGTYESASSISHINVPFPCKNSGTCSVSNASIDQNYLMYFTVISKASTNKLIDTFKKYSKYDLIGSDIVKVMCTIGWNEKNGQNNNNGNLYSFSQESKYNSGANHFTSPSNLMIISSFVFFIIAQFI